MGYMGGNALFDGGCDCVAFKCPHGMVLHRHFNKLEFFDAQLVVQHSSPTQGKALIAKFLAYLHVHICLYSCSFVLKLPKVVHHKPFHQVLVVLYHESGGLLEPQLIVSQSPSSQTQMRCAHHRSLHLEIVAVIDLVGFQGECSLHH